MKQPCFYASWQRMWLSLTIVDLTPVKTIREVLSLPEIFPKNTEYFNEEVLVRWYRKCKPEDKYSLLSRILKIG